MALESGLSVLICSIFFVFLVLLKQNVLIFVSQNLDNPILMSQAERLLFKAYDTDRNGVIDQDEFIFIARDILPTQEVVAREPQLGETYILVKADYQGTEILPVVKKTVEFTAGTFSVFHPNTIELGTTWMLYRGVRSNHSAYYSSYIRPSYSYYPLYQLLALLHPNVILNTHSRAPLSAAVVSALSDSHFRVSAMLSVEYQLSAPPRPPQWVTPCQGDCRLAGHVIFSRTSLLVESFSLECAGRSCESRMKLESKGAPYQYKIQDNKLRAVPIFPGEERVSYSWYAALEEWEAALIEYMK